MAGIQLKLKPSGQMQLSRRFLLLAAGGVLALVALLIVVQRVTPSVSSLFVRTAPEPVREVELPEVLKQAARPYAPPPPPPQPPVAQPVVKSAFAAAAPAPPAPPAPPVAAAPAPPPAPPPDFGALWDRQQATVAQTAREQQQAAKAVPAKEAPKTREPWIIRPIDISLKAAESKKDITLKAAESKKDATNGTEVKTEKPGAAPGLQGLDLIHHAKWQRPQYAWKTLYMSQQLPGALVDAVNSEEPGIIRVRLTTPIFAKEYDYELFPKDSVAILRQEGQPNIGTATLRVKLIQLEPVGWRGEVIQFEGSGADEQGAAGWRGKVNSHYGKLALLAGINAVLSLGLNSVGGTPGFGQVYQNPAQQAGKDAAQSATSDVRSLAQQQLRVPPTITKPAGAFVTIQLESNVYFGRDALVLR